jgi:hypothetical protein
MIERPYTRQPNGKRFQMGGFNTMLPFDAIPDTKYLYLQNVRAYKAGQMTGRSQQTPAAYGFASPVHSIRRLNDTTPLGPQPDKFAIISGSDDGTLHWDQQLAAYALTGNPVSMVPFRPNTSPQPWMYIGDSSQSAVIADSQFFCTGMLKVRSDGLTYKMGIKEPQNEPKLATQSVTVNHTINVLGTARPWDGALNSTFNFGDTGDGTNPSIIATPIPGAVLTLSAWGTAVIDGVSHGPGDGGPSGGSNPGQYASPPSMLLGAWTDNNGVIVSTAGAGVVNIGTGTTLTVPVGATRFQLGVNGTGGNFAANSGMFGVNFTLSTSAVASVPALSGLATAYYWGDSPHSGPVAAYAWRNAADNASGATVRGIASAVGSTTNNSLLFDTTPGTQDIPMSWIVLDPTGNPSGVMNVFDTALTQVDGSTPGTFNNFNLVIIGNLFIPSAGDYDFQVTSKDNVMWGIGGSASWSSKGSIRGALGQSMTVNGGFALCNSPAINGEGAAQTSHTTVHFPGSGIFPYEFNYDYWYHTGRTLQVLCNGANLVPLPASVKEAVQYRYVYRSSATGAVSNPSPASPSTSIPSILNEITPEWSNDPQVDKVDYYRLDNALTNFTWVGSGPNTNPPTAFTDDLLDADISANPLLQYDNFEPFPSIDLPHHGQVTVTGGVVSWVSGDPFDVRWLPGTIINIDGLAYTFYDRPASTTQLRAVNVPDQGTPVTYEISEPILAAQPMGSMWGDTDNIPYAFACGDPLRPGTLYFSKGNNLDSAPDTNQIEVCSPSEPLINGVMVNGIGMVFSAENGWTIYPTFAAALATVTGVQGTPFSLVRSSVTRGLYIRSCICADSSGVFYFRSKDGIEMSVGGRAQQSLTDGDLYNLFPHEGYRPQTLTWGAGSVTLAPPDDTQPEQQRLNVATGYLYYDYLGTDGRRYTLVFDTIGTGWVVDAYQWPVTVHMLEEGPKANTVLLGCQDGTIRRLQDHQAEVATCIVLTGCDNAGDARAVKTWGDVFIRGGGPLESPPMMINIWMNKYAYIAPQSVPMQIIPEVAGFQSYILDYLIAIDERGHDLGLEMQWPVSSSNFLDIFQPNWILEPEDTMRRSTDWTDAGSAGPMFVQGLTLECNTFGKPKNIAIQSDDGVLHHPDGNPIVANGRQKLDLTFTPPFVSHLMRIVSDDPTLWRLYPTPAGAWIQQPFPMAAVEWQTEVGSLGGVGWQHIRELNIAHLSTTDMTLTLVFDIDAVPRQIVLNVPNSGAASLSDMTRQAKTKITIPANKFKLVSFRLNSSSAFRIFNADIEVKRGIWGRGNAYDVLKPFGGPSNEAAMI